MKFRINRKKAVLAAVNILSLSGFLTFCLIGSGSAASQEYNYASERWQNGDDSMDYAQISCFMPESADFTLDSLGMVRASIISSLQNISAATEGEQKLCPDAYSASAGKAAVKGNILGRSDAEITAVGGDFFMIHGFKLIDGAFFSDNDLMQDGAVIDRNLAWALYGSYEVSGMKLTINDTQFYISGVIENPQTDEEKQCAGELPRAYISYDGASGFASSGGGLGTGYDGDGVTEGTAFSTVTCYEILMPDPVEDYAYSSVKKIMEDLGDDISVVQNTGRFEPLKRLKALKKISSVTVRDSAVVYPYWENASRIVQFRLSYIYLGAALCLIIPAATFVWLAVRAFKALRRNKKKIIGSAYALIKKTMTKGKKDERQQT